MDDILTKISGFMAEGTLPVQTKVTQSKTQLIPIKDGSNDIATPTQALAVVCFSKDRPYQLHQLLSSIKTTFRVPPTKQIVIYKPGQFRAHYDTIFKQNAEVTAVEESDFEVNLMEVISASLKPITGHVMFCVDDLIFHSPFDWSTIIHALRHDENLFCAQVKLHPGIWYSHPSSKNCPPPELSFYCDAYHRTGKEVEKAPAPAPAPALLSFPITHGNVDWSYPFDLCGGIYRISDIEELVKSATQGGPMGIMTSDIQREQASTHAERRIRNPNVFEQLINKAFWDTKRYQTRARALCLSRPIACVVTVNCVQETYKVPIYSEANDTGKIENLNNLIPLCDPPEHDSTELKRATSCEEDSSPYIQGLDGEQYRNDPYCLSAHVGALHFCATERRLENSAACEFTRKVAVLMAVRNGERFLRECLHSLLHQRQGCPYELVVVNDGSTDSTAGILDEIRIDLLSKGLAPSGDSVVMKVHHSDPVGLAAALDTGMNLVSQNIEYIARIDCDDMCESMRLHRQLEFLEGNPDIHVVGTQALLFKSSADFDVAEENREKVIMASGMPTHPAAVQWTMHFRCAILHPTVMFRRSIVLECGGYGREPYIEDYALWLRILQKYPLCIASLPDVLVRIRRHGDSKSAQEIESLRVASDNIRHKFIHHFLHGMNSISEHSVADISVSTGVDSTKRILAIATSSAPCCMLEGEHDIPTVLRMISYIHDRFSSYILEVSGKRCNGGNPTCADEVSKIVSDVLTHQVVRKKQKFLQSIQKQFGQSVMVKYMTQDKDMGDASQNQNATIDALKRSMIDALL